MFKVGEVQDSLTTIFPEVCTGLENQAVRYDLLEDFDSTIFYLEKAVECYYSLRDYESTAFAMLKVARLYKSNNYFVFAKRYLLQADSIFKMLNQVRLAAACRLELANIFLAENNSALAVKAYKEVIKLYGKNSTDNLTAELYNKIGLAFLQSDDFNSAHEYLDLADDLSQNLSDTLLILEIIKNKTLLFKSLVDYSKAQHELNRAFNVLKNKKFTNSKTEFQHIKAEILLSQKRTHGVKNLLDSASDFYSNNGSLENTTRCMKNYSALYELLNDERKAFDYYIRYTQLHDSLNVLNKKRYSSELQKLYESEKKKSELEFKDREILRFELDKQIMQNRFFGIFFILVVLTTLLLINHLIVKYRLKNKLQNKNQEIEHSNQALVRARARAQEADLVKAAFLASVSHEVRTPLNSIIGFSALFTKPNISIENKMEYVEHVYQSSKDLLNLINDIVDISKIHAGKLDINRENIDLYTEINAIQTIFSNDLLKSGKKNDIKFTVHISEVDKSTLIFTDGSKLRKVIMSLLGNALKFTDKGLIELSLRVIEIEKPPHGINSRKFRFIEFSVKDTGIGIEKEKHSYIFDSFRKASESQTKLYQGTGLGLSIAKHMVEMLGGEIWVESVVGQGSVFSFTIPYIERNITVNTNNLDKQSDTKTILIIEKDQYNYLLIKSLAILCCNPEIIWAKNSLEAIDIFTEKYFIDLVVLDLQSPELDGYETIRILQQINSEVIVLAQTNTCTNYEIQKIFAAGFADYFTKPIDSDKFVSVLSKFLKN